MQAIILAAGESSRFWPLNKTHKSQIKLLGESLVYWTIKGLAENGVKNIAVIINPRSSLKEDLKSVFQDLGVNLSYFVQEKPLGTGNAIALAKNFIKGPFFIVWPSKVFTKDIAGKILERYQSVKPQMVFVGTETATPWDYGIFKLAGEKIVEIVENPKPGQEPSKIEHFVIDFLEPDYFNYYQLLPKHHEADYIDALNLYLKDKKSELISCPKNLPSLKYPWNLLEIFKKMLESENFKEYLASSAVIGKNVVINGKVYIGENAKIGENTVINGPCYIGAGSEIGVSNILRGPVNLEKEVKTGAFCEIKNTIIQEGTHLHSGYFGDSIIGKNCRFGAGFISANRKLDRENIKSIVKNQKKDTGLTYFGAVVGDKTRFGVHCSTMPGVLIGSNCVVGPGSVVFENIEDDTTFYTKFEKVVKKNE